MNLNKEETALMISVLVNDKVGKWGDGREERIKALLIKIKKDSK
jgi:hypothetical protein